MPPKNSSTPVTPEKKGSKSSPNKKGSGSAKARVIDRSRVVATNKKYANNIDVYLTKVPEIAISVATKAKESAGGTFTYYIQKKFDDAAIGEELSKMWGVVAISPRRNQGQNGMGFDGIMPQYPGSKYDWVSFVTIMYPEDTAEKVGKQLARGLTKFTRQKDLSGMDNPESYVFRTAHEDDLKPLSFYLLDDQVVVMLNKLYGHLDLDEVKKEDEVLEQFFESADKAREALALVDEDDWEEMM